MRGCHGLAAPGPFLSPSSEHIMVFGGSSATMAVVS